ncbi:MAG: LPP20 family lipoprotein [candidate division KSB1 bacterium]|nr:LPP20 family lipoprotein [candidate division KSB1 bacterium]MDZ7294482.1 LPP20 family lipoprotein [candidate division KSB1 bacterium]MDZ7385336.1 LPP20 family lipoprotein [candidate division KSB1 bacterium]MDZ7392460.1 LPP20 family lipoprotein [candidate division KSB1 bacterium]MDZ7412251.1 LPP20 family lipoprotein [candidate division KSB1 bacterium]
MKAVRGILVCVVTLSATVAWSQYVTQPIGAAGNIDWSRQVIRATGIGAPNPDHPLAAQRAGAIEAAKRAAFRNLLEAVQGVQLTSEVTVRNAMVENDVINTRVQGVLRNFTIVDTKYMSTGDVEVTVEMPLTGALADVLLPTTVGGGVYPGAAQPLCPMCGQPWPAGKPVPPGVQLIQPGAPGVQAAPGAAAYTGLIIDTKGLGVRPAMAPKVLDENGQEVYGSKFVSRDWAVQIGMVGYDKDINRARSNERVTNNPLVVKALKAAGANKADVVISNADAAAIHAASSTQSFLDKCRVMFIVD